MTNDAVETPLLPSFPQGMTLPIDRVSYGPDIPDESQLRLLGDLSGKRVLQLGCGSGHNTVALNRAGARVIVFEPRASRIEAAKDLFEKHNVRVELIHGDLASLASVRAESIDIALSIYALSSVDDLPRVFRQVHRVLRPDHPFVFSLPHPAYAMVESPGAKQVRVKRSYWDAEPRVWTIDDDEDIPGVDYGHTLNRLFVDLVRNNFMIDTLAEPEPQPGSPRSEFWAQAMEQVPSTLILRARKQGL